MTGTCEYAASVARQTAATEGSQEFVKLSGLMCWNAVAHVALLAGIIDDKKYKSLYDHGEKMVRTSDSPVASAAALNNVPPGHVIGFFSEGKIIHAMVSLGEGRAAGVKNECVVPGAAPYGWNNLDLANGLSWSGDGIAAPQGVTPDGKAVTRSVQVFHRPITALGTES